ncbi:putative alcohol dehydrogenase [Helianthus anomalus]
MSKDHLMLPNCNTPKTVFVIVSPPKRREVRIKIISTFLCHSDLSFWKMKDPPAIYPRILGHEAFGGQPASTWPLGPTNTVPYANQVNQAIVPKGWHNGDWICTCGFHNYSSRSECKKCNASMPPGDYNTSSLTPFLYLDFFFQWQRISRVNPPCSGLCPRSKYNPIGMIKCVIV